MQRRFVFLLPLLAGAALAMPHAASGSSPSAREQRSIASHRRSTASSSLKSGKTLRAHILPGTAATHHWYLFSIASLYGFVTLKRARWARAHLS